MIKMNKLHMVPLMIGAFTSGLFTDALTKIVLTTVAMLVATTVSLFWRRYLEHLIANPHKKPKVFFFIKNPTAPAAAPEENHSDKPKI